MNLSDIREAAQKIADSTNYEAQPNTPTKKLARLVAALAEHLEVQPSQTLATVNAALDDSRLRG
jgi:uncharacterized protein with HEPN domain